VLDRAHNGRINQEQFRQFLMRYNIFVPHDQLMGLLKRYDDFGDGTMNLAQFIRHVLPPDYPDNYTPKPPTPELAALKAVIQKNAEDTGLEVEELPPEKPLVSQRQRQRERDRERERERERQREGTD
jgi:hypothetical protein